MWGCELDGAGSGQVQVAGTCNRGNEHFVSIICEELLDQLRTSYIPKKDSSPWSEEVSKQVSN